MPAPKPVLPQKTKPDHDAPHMHAYTLSRFREYGWMHGCIRRMCARTHTVLLALTTAIAQKIWICSYLIADVISYCGDMDQFKTNNSLSAMGLRI